MNVRKSASIATAVACALLGCSQGPGPYPVSGRIVFDDGSLANALKNGSVTFESTELGVSSSGDIRDGGLFTLNYLRKGDGALAGTYKVIISPFINPEGPPDQRIPPVGDEYLSLAKTPLTVIVEKKTNDVTLTVTRRKSKK